MDEKLQISIKSGKAYAHSLTEIVMTPDGQTIEERYRTAEQFDAARQTQFVPYAGFGGTFGKGVNLLHFSDLHGDAINLARVVNVWQKIPFPVTALFTGDMVKYTWNDGIAAWTDLAATKDILTVIGNHDSHYGGNYYGKTAAECYARYIGPNVDRWGVTYQANLCYYYKDWAEKNLRLIVLDVMHWDATQQTWLESTLASAKTAGYAVVISAHCAPYVSDGGIRTCSFDTIDANHAIWEVGYGVMDASVPAAVKDFKDAGGKFVCYLCGHTHADMFRHSPTYTDQLYVAVGNTGINAHITTDGNCVLDRVVGQKSEDLFNLVSINAAKSTLSIVRIGADHDTIGRHIGSVVYDYANHQILWND